MKLFSVAVECLIFMFGALKSGVFKFTYIYIYMYVCVLCTFKGNVNIELPVCAAARSEQPGRNAEVLLAGGTTGRGAFGYW